MTLSRPGLHYVWREFIKQLDPHAYFIYQYLCTRINSNNEAWPSVGLMVQETGISNRTIIRKLRELEELGFIKITRTGRHNTYHLPKAVSLLPQEDLPNDDTFEVQEVDLLSGEGNGVPVSESHISDDSLTHQMCQKVTSDMPESHIRSARGSHQVVPSSSSIEVKPSMGDPASQGAQKTKWILLVEGPEGTSRCSACNRELANGQRICPGCLCWVFWEDEDGNPAGDAHAPFSELSAHALMATCKAGTPGFRSRKQREQWERIEKAYEKEWILECIEEIQAKGGGIKRLTETIDSPERYRKWRQDTDPNTVYYDEFGMRVD